MPIDYFGILFLGLWSIVVGIFLYSAYWAFIVRSALQQGLYKKQAQWVAGMAIYFVALSAFLTLALSFNINMLPTNILGGLLIAAGFIIQFLWIDYTVRVARRSDPLNRDTAHWSKLRYVWALATFGGAVGALGDAIYAGFSTTAPFGGILFFGAIAIILSARRSSDPTLRNHLKWMGLSIFTLWLGGQASPVLFRFLSNSSLAESITYVIVLLAAYGLYRSAKSLIPTTHIPKLDSVSPIVSSSTTLSP